MAPERYRATPTRSKTPAQGQNRRTAAQSARAPQGQARRPAGQNQRSARAPLSPAEQHRAAAKKEAIRRRKEELARQRRIRRERRKRLFKLCFSVALIFFVLYWVYVGVSIVNRPDGSENALSLLVFRQGERKALKEYEPEKVCIGDTKYLPVSFLEQFFAISQFGDQKTRSFLICADGEFATFYIGNEEVIINGEHVSMRAPALLIDNELHLPIDFFAEKMSCFELGKNNATYGADVLTYDKEKTASFVFKTCTAEQTVDYSTVPVLPPTTEQNKT